jgi:hypothetical protein
VVLDLLLRRRTGLSVLGWMKSEAALSRIPVIILTGTKRARDLAEARALGAAAFFVKPFHFGDLAAMVAAMLVRWEVLHRAGTSQEPVGPEPGPGAAPPKGGSAAVSGCGLHARAGETFGGTEQGTEVAGSRGWGAEETTERPWPSDRRLGGFRSEFSAWTPVLLDRHLIPGFMDRASTLTRSLSSE